ncbi:MAG TPA: c-type cytochrome [Solirubrobacterales bacterium]|jgi:mono/diheme cytochrome c family protein|nr:c-type cytochrome [Solirubrobacterales bacterium]
MRSHRKLIRPLLALAALAATVAVASGCGTTSADTARGRELFKTKCGVCHTLAQAGTTATIGPSLDSAFASAREAGENGDTIEGIVKAQVEFPRPNTGDPAVSMPADIVTGQDLDDVAAYVGEWAGVPGAEPPQVPGGPGAQVFANNGCGGCHTLAAASSGGSTGPNLNETLAPDDTVASIEEMIVDPNSEIAEGYKANVMPQTFGQTLSKKELEDLIDFLYENTPAGEGKAGAKSSKGG